jgi:hypothetical protein
MISNMPNSAKTYLLKIYNLILDTGQIPCQWRDIIIVPIPKPNDPSSKLRPIALLSCICKIFHLMITRRLEWYIENKMVLSPYTTGFRRARSSQDSLVQLVSRIQIGFIENLSTLACFLNIEGAYNNV